MLTDKKARALKPDDKPVFDGKVTGLLLTPSKSGCKWTLRFTSPLTGKRRDAGLGTHPETSIGDAREKAQAMRKIIDGGQVKAATIDDLETAMRTLKGRDFKLFVLESLDILEQHEMYEKHFGQAGMNFLEACRRIVRAEKENRFGRLLRTLFAESKVPALLAEGGIEA